MAVFSVAPVVQNLMPSAAQAAHTDIEKPNSKNNKNKGKPKSRPRVSSPLKPVISWLKKDLIRTSALGATMLFGGKFLYDVLKSGASSEISPVSPQTTTSNVLIPPVQQGMDINELKSNLGKMKAILQNYVAEKPEENDVFANIPLKARFSKSEEAETLINEINDAINVDDSLNYESALKLYKKVIEFWNAIEKQEQFEKENRLYDREFFNPSFGKIKDSNFCISIEDLCTKLKAKKIMLGQRVPYVNFLSFKAIDVSGAKKLLVEIFDSIDKAEEAIKARREIDAEYKVVKVVPDEEIMKIQVVSSKNAQETKDAYVVVSERITVQNAWQFSRNLRLQNEETKELQMLKFIYLSALQIKELHDTGYIHGEMVEYDFRVYTKGENIKIKLKYDYIVKDKTKRLIGSSEERGSCALDYLSPEWCSLEEDVKFNVHPARDVWNFGCIIYRMLNDQCCFSDNSKSNQEIKNELKKQHDKYFSDGKEWTQKHGDPGTSSNRNLESRWQQTPENLDELAERCLIINPEKRATMDEIIKWSGELLIKKGVAGPWDNIPDS